MLINCIYNQETFSEKSAGVLFLPGCAAENFSPGIAFAREIFCFLPSEKDVFRFEQAFSGKENSFWKKFTHCSASK